MTDNPQPARRPLQLWGALKGWIATSILCTFVLGIAQGSELVLGPLELAEDNLLTAFFGLSYFVSGLAYLLTLVISAILTIWLTYRLMRNLHVLQAPGDMMEPGWAAASYLIPFANLVMPPRAIGQIWRGTFELANISTHSGGRIALWWALYFASLMLDRFANIHDAGARDDVTGAIIDLAGYQTSIYLFLGAWIVFIVASILMVRVFGPIAKQQEDLIATASAT